MFAIKADIRDAGAGQWAFDHQKTMYGGKHIAAGNTIFVFASENEGGSGLVARGLVVAVLVTPRTAGVERQTPRVSIHVKRTGIAKRRLGRAELRAWKAWEDGRPETELNFKFYRQATNKIVGISAAAAAYLEGFFQLDPCAPGWADHPTRRA